MGDVRRCESGRHAERRADVHRERRRFRKRRFLFARRVRELVAAQRGQVQADVAENAECVGESVAGVALGQ